jgi:hypothetical protein
MAEARDACRQAKIIAEKLQRKQMIFNAHVLELLIDGLDGLKTAAEALKRMLPAEEGLENGAYLRFALWRVTGEQGWRREALQIVDRLIKENPNLEVGLWCEEMKNYENETKSTGNS